MGHKSQFINCPKMHERIDLVRPQPAVQCSATCGQFNLPEHPKLPILRKVSRGNYGYYPEEENVLHSHDGGAAFNLVELPENTEASSTFDASPIESSLPELTDPQDNPDVDGCQETDTQPDGHNPSLEKLKNTGTAFSCAQEALPVNNGRPEDMDPKGGPASINSFRKSDLRHNGYTLNTDPVMYTIPISTHDSAAFIGNNPEKCPGQSPVLNSPLHTHDLQHVAPSSFASAASTISRPSFLLRYDDSPPLSPSISYNSLSESDRVSDEVSEKEPYAKSEEEFNGEPNAKYDEEFNEEPNARTDEESYASPCEESHIKSISGGGSGVYVSSNMHQGPDSLPTSFPLTYTELKTLDFDVMGKFV